MRASLAAAFVCLMAATVPAFADVTPSDLAGRWVTYVADPKLPCTHPSCRLAYDLVPCGDGWCGIEVKEDKTCDRTAMRVDAGAPTPHGVAFMGRYERTDATQPYMVKAHLYPTPRPATPGQLFLHVQGTTDGDFQPFRRTYPLQMLLSRAGDALCTAQPKVS